MSKGEYWLGLDGLDHGVWMALVLFISAGISAYFYSNLLSVLAIQSAVGVCGIVFFYLIERNQEKNMTTRAPNMNWREWWLGRLADMAYPYTSILSSVGTVLVIWLVWNFKP